MREFVAFTQQVEQHAATHATTDGDTATVAAWEANDIYGSGIRITFDYSEHGWAIDDIVLAKLVPSIKGALADIDHLRNQKAKTPW